ncbi:MAG: MFS transporter [Anaerolineae bacterium]|jgi:MFS family permease
MTAYLSEAEYDTYIEKNAQWNFWVNVLDLAFYNLAMSFIYGSTVLSLYASYLTDSAVLIGLLPAVQSVMFLLPQMLLVSHAQRAPRKKSLLLQISIFERLPYALVAAGIFFWPGAPRSVAYAILMFSMIVATGAGGVGAPAWKAMLAKVIPIRRRGTMFGLSHAVGGVLGIGGAAISRHVLATYGYPWSFGISFALCFASQIISYIAVSLVREPARDPHARPSSALQLYRAIPGLLKSNPNFARYLLGTCLLTFGTMGTALYIVYGRRVLGITDAVAGNLTMVALIGQSISAPILGRVADRRGNKWLLELAPIINAAAILLMAVAANELWLYPTFVLVNVALQASSIAGMGITMEFSTADDVPAFTAMAGTITGIPTLLAPLLGGALVDWGGFPVLFGVGLAFCVAGYLIMRLAVQEPRHHQPGSIERPVVAAQGEN